VFYFIHCFSKNSAVVVFILSLISGLSLLLAAAPVFSTTLNIPDNTAREVLREKERQQQLRQREEIKPDVRLQKQNIPIATDKFPEQESPCFTISEIKLLGELSEQFVFALESVRTATGRCLGVQGINVVITRVQNAIVEKGFITTRVLAAPQDLKSGTLELTMIPGIVDAIRFESDSPQRLISSALPTSAGDLLNLRDIEQGLENFKRVPSAEADFEIQPATAKDAQVGESDLVIRHEQKFPLRVSLSLDDGGAKSTGRNQAGLTISYDNPLSLNDLFYISLNRDFEGGDSSERGTAGYTVHYSIPWKKWLFSATGSVFDFRQTVATVNQEIRYSGESKTAELRISRSLYRDAQRRTSGYVRAYLRSSRNFINDIEVSLQRRRTAGYEVGINHREYLGRGTLDASVAYRRGTGAFNSLAAPEDPFGEGASRPEIYTASLLFNLPFSLGSQRLRYNANFRLQHNITPLVPQDRFFIGGRHTVRGFDGENVFSADRGWFIRNDISLALAKTSHEVYLGLDHGEVAGQSSELLLGKRLTGVVVGARGSYKKLSYDIFTGRPVSKPDGFRTAKNIAGFNLTYVF